jgi:phage tail-like protein
MAQGVAYSFDVTIDGVTIPAVQEVSGLKVEMDVVEQKENTAEGKYVINRLPGRHKGGDLTITRVLTKDDKAFEDWLVQSFAGLPTSHRSGAVNIKDTAGEIILTINFNQGWPSKVEGSAGKAGDTSVRTEKITIVHNGLSIPAAQLIF